MGGPGNSARGERRGYYLDSLSAGDLTIEVGSGDGGAIVCTWRGRSTERNPGQVLNPYFEKLLEAAVGTEGGGAIEMHFETLEHFNSSTISSLIRLIQNARGKKIPLVMVYDHNLKWQRLSFEALRVFDKSDKMFELRTA